MRSRPLAWIDRVDVFGADARAEHRRHLADLRREIKATREAIDGAQRCIDETLAVIAQLNRMIDTDRRG